MEKMVSIALCMLLLSSMPPMAIAQGTDDDDQHETRVEALSNDLLRVVESFDPLLLQRTGPGPGYYDTSEYLIGSVALGVIFLESNGVNDPNTENWTSTEVASVRSEINQTITWWAAQNSYAGITFALDVQLNVQISYEPIIHPSPFTDPAWEKLWVSEAMASLGYTSGDWMKRTRDYLNAIRLTYSTDWAYAVYIVDSSADIDGCFSDGYSAYGYLGGPFVVMTYDNGGWGIAGMDQVFAHETGHIFWATDEYNGVTEYSGYLNAADVEGSGCLMDTNVLTLSSGTQLQVGWRDTDGDTILDIIDTFPETTVIPYTPDPTSNHILVYTGNAMDVAYPNQNPQPSDPGNDITLNCIVLVLYRIDGGTYMPTAPSDGAWDEWQEGYTFTTVYLPSGSHLIEVVSMNSVSNVDQTPARDTVTVDNPPNNPTISGPASGRPRVEYSYNVSTVDSDGDQVSFFIDWGDGTTSGWLGPVASGGSVMAKHTWSTKGNYTIQAKARDPLSMESGWGTLQVAIPVHTPANQGFMFLDWGHHPFLNLLLQILMQWQGNR